MPGGAAIVRAIARAAARAAAERAAVRGGRYADDARGSRGRRGRGARGRGTRIDTGEGGADFVEFESTAVEAAERGMAAMAEMAGNRGQIALLQEVAPKYGRYAEQLAQRGGRPAWSQVRGMSEHPDAIEDILQEGFEHLVKSYRNDVESEELQLLFDDEDEGDGLDTEDE